MSRRSGSTEPSSGRVVRLNPEIKEHFERAAERGPPALPLPPLVRPSPTSDPDTLDALIDALEPVTVDEGEIVVRQGERLELGCTSSRSGRLRVGLAERGRRARRHRLHAARRLLRRALAAPRGAARGQRRGRHSGDAARARREPTSSGSPHPTPRSGPSSRSRSPAYDFRFVARVPLDFAEELLPADSVMPETVGLEQVDEVREGPPAGAHVAEEWAGAERRAGRKRIKQLPARLADRRDGLRRRLPGDGLPPLRAGCQPAAPPQGRLHGSRRHEPAGIAAGAESVGLRVRSVKASKTRLDELPLPAVCHFEGNHWVVLFDTDGRNVRLADPARRRRPDEARGVRGEMVGLRGAPRLRSRSSRKRRSARRRCSGSGSSSARSPARSPSPGSWPWSPRASRWRCPSSRS